MSGQSSEERISQKISRESAKNPKKNTVIIIIVIGIVIIAVTAFILIFAHQTKPKRNVVVTPDNVDEILSNTEEPTKPGTYEVKMNTTWNFDKGNSTSSNAYVENSTSNTNAVDFDIVLSETGETIFKSPVIPVGSHLENITLDKALEKGTHACVLTYHLLDDKGDITGKLNLNLTINVAG